MTDPSSALWDFALNVLLGERGVVLSFVLLPILFALSVFLVIHLHRMFKDGRGVWDSKLLSSFLTVGTSKQTAGKTKAGQLRVVKANDTVVAGAAFTASQLSEGRAPSPRKATVPPRQPPKKNPGAEWSQQVASASARLTSLSMALEHTIESGSEPQRSVNETSLLPSQYQQQQTNLSGYNSFVPSVHQEWHNHQQHLNPDRFLHSVPVPVLVHVPSTHRGGSHVRGARDTQNLSVAQSYHQAFDDLGSSSDSDGAERRAVRASKRRRVESKKKNSGTDSPRKTNQSRSSQLDEMVDELRRRETTRIQTLLAQEDATDQHRLAREQSIRLNLEASGMVGLLKRSRSAGVEERSASTLLNSLNARPPPPLSPKTRLLRRESRRTHFAKDLPVADDGAEVLQKRTTLTEAEQFAAAATEAPFLTIKLPSSGSLAAGSSSEEVVSKQSAKPVVENPSSASASQRPFSFGSNSEAPATPTPAASPASPFSFGGTTAPPTPTPTPETSAPSPNKVAPFSFGSAAPTAVVGSPPPAFSFGAKP